MATPVRDFWPLDAAAGGLALARADAAADAHARLRAPGLSAISLSFIVKFLKSLPRRCAPDGAPS